MASLQNVAYDKKKCVVLLDNQYAFGVDFRFKEVKPQCVIYKQDLSQKYLLRQMAGRAQRDTHRADCAVYVVEDPAAQQTLQTKLHQLELKPFKEGPRILRDIMEKARPVKTKQGGQTKLSFMHPLP